MASWQQVRWRLLQLAVEKQPARLEVIDPNGGSPGGLWICRVSISRVSTAIPSRVWD